LEHFVARRRAELEKAMQRLRELTAHDELTGVGNRRDLNDKLSAELELSVRTGMPFCVAVLGLDGLKAVNDCFGHAAGDAAIKGFAGVIASEKRAMDDLARYGRDEFVLLLRNITLQEAARLAGAHLPGRGRP
jgi:diguanylate cyclase